MPYAGGKKVLDSFYTLDQVFWQQFDRGAQAACGALGLEHIRLVDNSDVNVQLSGFENAPTQGINMAIARLGRLVLRSGGSAWTTRYGGPTYGAMLPEHATGHQ
jgi:hypothetical protein